MQTRNQLIQEALGKDALEAAYCQQVLQAIDQQGEGHADGPDISALPTLTCEVNGGEPHQAAPIAAAWHLIRLAAKLFDDAEDGEAGNRSAEITNIATGLLSAAPLMLWEPLEQEVPADRVRRLTQALHRAVLRACAGQHADLAANRAGADNLDPDTWLEIAQSKSGALLAWAAWAGALAAGADERILAGYREYGCHLGVLLQVADDFNGVWSSTGACDLGAARPVLPVCYALYVAEGKEQDHLRALLQQAAQEDHTAETQARQLLVDLGAQAYMLVVARMQHQLALAALHRAGCIPPANRQLVALLDQTMPALKTRVEDRDQHGAEA